MLRQLDPKLLAATLNFALKLLDHGFKRAKFAPAKRAARNSADSTVPIREHFDVHLKYVCI